MKTTPKNTYPLGYIELPNGAKPIYPMNDIFINYAFQLKEHWEALRLLVNLVIDAYIQYKPDTKIEPIAGIKEVITQFKYLLNTQNTTRDQDIKLIEINDSFVYIEFQNRGKPAVPIEIRSVQYFGLGIAHSEGKPANQIWLLAEDVEPLLHGKTFARYVLKDEVTGKEHPEPSGILYVSLPKLAEGNGPASELARFLLGKITDTKIEVVSKIVKSFIAGFVKFKEEKEVNSMLSLHERGVEEGIEKGLAIGAAKILELIKSGLSPDEAFRKFSEGQQELAESN